VSNTINSYNSYNSAYPRNVSSAAANISVSAVRPVFSATQKPKEDLLELSGAYKAYAAAAQKSKIAVLNLNGFQSASIVRTNDYDGAQITDTFSFSKPITENASVSSTAVSHDVSLSAYQKNGILTYMKNAGYFSEAIQNDNLINLA